MHTRTISIRNLSRADEASWRDLAARSVEANPFYEADFLVPACRHLRNGKNVVLLVAEEAGRFHACLPVRPVSLHRILSPPVVTPWRNSHSYLGTPLVAAERGVAAMGSILFRLRGPRMRPRLVVLELFGDGGPAAMYLRRAAGELGLTVHVVESGERAVFRYQDEAGHAVPPPKVRKERQWRRLCRDCGDPSVVDRAGDQDSPADFLEMEAAGWKGRAGTALASRAGDAAFYREMTARFRDSERLRLYSLEVNGRKLAMDNYLRVNGDLFGWKMAYDEQFASYGPGTQLQLQVFDLARRDHLRSIDSCSGTDNNHSLQLFPDRRLITTLLISGSRNAGDRVPALALRLVRQSGRLRGVSAVTLRHKLAATAKVPWKVVQR